MPIASAAGHLCIKGQTVLQDKERWGIEKQSYYVYTYLQNL